MDKHTFHTKLDMIKILSLRIAFARLMISSHRVKVEIGKLTRPATPVENSCVTNAKN